MIPHESLFQHQLGFAMHLTWNVTNVTFIFAASPNAKPKEKMWGDIAYYVPPPENVKGTRPQCPPPNCAHSCNDCIPFNINCLWIVRRSWKLLGQKVQNSFLGQNLSSGKMFLAAQFFLFIDILLKLQQPVLICFCNFNCNSVVIEDLLRLLA